MGLQGLPHSLRPVLHLYVGVGGRHIDGDSDEDGALGEGPNVLEELEKVQSVLHVGCMVLADVLDMLLHVVADILSDGPGP